MAGHLQKVDLCSNFPHWRLSTRRLLSHLISKNSFEMNEHLWVWNDWTKGVIMNTSWGCVDQSHRHFVMSAVASSKCQQRGKHRALLLLLTRMCLILITPFCLVLVLSLLIHADMANNTHMPFKMRLEEKINTSCWYDNHLRSETKDRKSFSRRQIKGKKCPLTVS